MDLVLTSRVALFSLAICGTAAADTNIVAQEDFEGATSKELIKRLQKDGWSFESTGSGQLTSDVDLSGQLGRFVCVSRADRNGQSYLQKTFTGWSGSYRMRVQARAVDIVSGPRWPGGQIQLMVKTGAHEDAYPSSQFQGSFEWRVKNVEVLDLTPDQVVVLRMGLQDGKGKVCFDHVVVTSTGD